MLDHIWTQIALKIASSFNKNTVQSLQNVVILQPSYWKLYV